MESKTEERKGSVEGGRENDDKNFQSEKEMLEESDERDGIHGDEEQAEDTKEEKKKTKLKP